MRLKNAILLALGTVLIVVGTIKLVNTALFRYRDQLVATNDKLEILGRTQLYDHNLTLRKCGSFSGP